jgi:hypothetical protein
MAMQITAIFRQGVVRPLDARARDQITTFFVDDAARCEWLPIVGGTQFGAIWDSGLLQAIGVACNVRLTDYEEVVLPPEQIENARTAVAPFLANAESVISNFALCLHGLLSDALRDQMPVLFVL